VLWVLSVIYVAAVVEITYASWIIEIPDSDNVGVNYRKTIPYRVSFEVGAGPQGFPVSCNQGSMFACCSNGETELCLPTLHKHKDMINRTLEEKPHSMDPWILRRGSTLCAISVTTDVIWASGVSRMPT
jgi:hypothetical protein